ncbi:hypothetical protein [Methanococcoides sp. FTZ1]|uniref:hypothetical protein n=1 Tax=Methanococcoides sp. FTZ1 TaxID=3439061 RepID=UPI003F863372
MYVRTRCSHCNKVDYHDIAINTLVRKTVFSDHSQMMRYLIENIDVDETISEEEMARSVLQELRGYVYDGITTYELCRILKEYFGVVAMHCCDLIQKMKIELDMYCPDHQHLYFVEA